MMKKAIVSICMASLLLGLSSCRSSKDAAALSSISGEWNIIELNGAAVVPASGQEFPFIGFNTITGRVYGNSGCNRMMGTFDKNAKPGMLDLGALASTRMACPDMTLEQNVLAALGQVKKYKKLGKQNMALCGSSNHPIIVLQKKEASIQLADLNGKWMISEVSGAAIPTGMENQPFIEFDMTAKRVHGNAGCNIFNGAFQTNVNHVGSIAFPQLISTMMACPDMEVEGRILKALNAVQTFDKLAGGGIGLYDGTDTLMLVLVKK